MKPIKSTCTFLRRQLKIKGMTEHNGRGAYELWYDIEPEELKERILALKSKLQNADMLEKDTEPDSHWIRFQIKASCFTEERQRNWGVSYSTVAFRPSTGWLLVLC